MPWRRQLPHYSSWDINDPAWTSTQRRGRLYNDNVWSLQHPVPAHSTSKHKALVLNSMWKKQTSIRCKCKSRGLYWHPLDEVQWECSVLRTKVQGESLISSAMIKLPTEWSDVGLDSGLSLFTPHQHISLGYSFLLEGHVKLTSSYLSLTKWVRVDGIHMGNIEWWLLMANSFRTYCITHVMTWASGHTVLNM